MVKKYNTCVVEVPGRGGGRGTDAKAIFEEIMIENFSKLFKDIKPQTQEHYKHRVYIESHT